MKNNKIIYILYSSLILLPVITFGALDGVRGLIKAFGGILNSLIPVIFGLCLVYFFWGVSQFILKDAANEQTRAEGKQKIIWGVVALFVFISIYGILAKLSDLLDIPLSNGSGGTVKTGTAIQLPDGSWQYINE